MEMATPLQGYSKSGRSFTTLSVLENNHGVIWVSLVRVLHYKVRILAQSWLFRYPSCCLGPHVCWRRLTGECRFADCNPVIQPLPPGNATIAFITVT